MSVFRMPQSTRARPWRGPSLAAGLLTLALGCLTGHARSTATEDESAPTLVFSTELGAGFFDLPFPLDARRRANGAPDLRRFPNPRGAGFVKRALDACAERSQGFSPATAIYFRFDGPPGLQQENPLRSLRPDARAFVVDVDPRSEGYLQRHPVLVRSTLAADGVRPAHLLQIMPPAGLALRPGTTYAALVLRRAPASTDRAARLGQPPPLRALLRGRAFPAAPAGLAQRLRQAYAPLARALPRLGLRADDVAAATVFTTDDPTALLRGQIAWARRQPALQPKSLERQEQRAGCSVLRGRVAMPRYQDGIAPYLACGGRQILDTADAPVMQGRDEVEFELSVPHGRMPRAGFPLYFYVHGTGGEARQLSTRGYRLAPDQPGQPGTMLADLAAAQGWAASCVDGPFSPNRIGLRALDGYAAYNFFRPAVMRDNFLQMMLEQVHFLDLLRDLRIDAALLPAVELDPESGGRVRFDVEHMVVGGQSLGSYLAGMLAAVSDDFRGAILTGAGGSWIEFAFGPKDPLDLLAALEALTLDRGDSYDRFHPFLTLFEMAAGPADNTLYLPLVLRRPKPGRRPPHVLVIEGQADLQVPTNLQRALVLALGVDLLGVDVGDRPRDRLQPVLPWGGLRQLSGQARGNRPLPAGEPRTAVVVRYPEDGILEGHYVTYQWQAPRDQIAVFLRAVAAGEAPAIPDLSGRVGERPR
ncbi:MAG: hypothetical protein JXR83_13460 [Deltaproteobacteria bacterium]|nr:hypothetical protein [Deltaproteobacteria bacterium]